MYARVTGVLVFGDVLESDKWTVTLLNTTGSVVTQSCSGVDLLGRTYMYRVEEAQQL